MTAKVRIVEHLGEAQVLLPELLSAALEANDRAKVRMSLLQEALTHAQNPAAVPNGLEMERRATGLDDPVFSSTVTGARALEDGRFAIPGAERLLAGLKTDIEAMVSPIALTSPENGQAFAKRFEAMSSTI